MTDRDIQKDKLIELVDKAKEEYANDITDHTETDYIVETLLNEGAILPPCKVGDMVYSLREVSCEDIDGAHTECEYYGFGTDDRICTLNKPQKCPHKYRIFKCLVTEYNLLSFSRRWNKTVFLTKEEAEEKLRELGK